MGGFSLKVFNPNVSDWPIDCGIAGKFIPGNNSENVLQAMTSGANRVHMQSSSLPSIPQSTIRCQV